jgi:broad specificity phosphatase PhoE
MSSIILVRHGQASFGRTDYDQLCANGQVQASLLGEYWSRRQMLFDGVYSGPRRRQLDTARIVAEKYRDAGVDFPEPKVMNDFDEYHAEAVLRECLPRLVEVDANVRELRRAYEVLKTSGDPEEKRRAFQKMFEAVITKWGAGEVAAEGIESWNDFCSRVERGLASVGRETPPAGNSVIFTSAGAIGAAVKRALHLSTAGALQITWMSRNASFTSFLASGDRFRLSTFNAHPHLESDGLLTYR